MNRRKARECAFTLIFQYKFNPDGLADALELFFDENDAGEQNEYIKNVVLGVTDHIAEIDAKIVENLKDWTFERISPVSLALLRLAIFEIFYRSDIPISITNNEAADLASRFESEQTAAFVSGVLGKIQKEIEAKDAD
jgi:N utilization substance protein B